MRIVQRCAGACFALWLSTLPCAAEASPPEALALLEYHAGPTLQGWQAPNRRQGFRALFDERGVRILDRAAGSTLVELTPVRLGRDVRDAIGAGTVSAAGPRVEIRRPQLLEWYENQPAGLEQGFLLHQPPRGRGPLVLELEVRGAVAEFDGATILLHTRVGRTLEYKALAVYDASGAPVASQMRVAGSGRIELLVDDGGAMYPLLIDPLLSATADAQLESDDPGAALGYSVAGAGDVNGDGYDDVIVGAPFFDAGQVDEGAAFVFLGSAAGVASADPSGAHAQIESNLPGCLLGLSVAGAGDVNMDGYDDVVVGAPLYTNGEISEGAAFVYLGSASGITGTDPTNAHATLEGNQPGAGLGISVAGAGDVDMDGYDEVLAAANIYDDGEINEGAVFAWHGSASGIVGTGPVDADAQLESDQGGAQLGSAASAGDVNGDGYSDVIVGSQSYDAGEADEGAAFIFLGSAAGLVGNDPGTAHAQLESDDSGALLGWSVAGAGDVDGNTYDDVIVGAPLYTNGEASEGGAFVFLGSAAGVASGDPGTAHAVLESDQSSAQLGRGVAGAGDVNADGYGDVIAGAPNYTNGEVSEGAVFVFLGSPSGITGNDPGDADAQLESDQPSAAFGWSTAAAGDVDGDLAADVIVGARIYAAGESGEGAAFIYRGELPPKVPSAGRKAQAWAALVLVVLGTAALRRVRARR